MVPLSVANEVGAPVSHGVVDRCYDRFRECVARYVRDKQEDHAYMPPTCGRIIYVSITAWIQTALIMFVDTRGNPLRRGMQDRRK